MTKIVNNAVVFDCEELAWFAEQYGAIEWIVYTAGMDEIATHDKQAPGEEPQGEPYTEETARAHVAWTAKHFGPGSPMDMGSPLYAVALHYGVPVNETAVA